jgi:transcriptional regulator
MHPNPAFRSEERALLETLIDEIGFGMIFAQTPDGPRVAHTPLLYTGDGALQFHLARGNALTRQLDGTTALAVVNGPDAYVSPRWYQDQTRVPTWNYVALELEGRVRRVDEDGLLALLEGLSDRHEARIAEGMFWKIDKVPEAKLKGLLGAIVGFELEVLAWRPTLKLSQRDAPGDIAGAIAGLEAQGSHAIAALMRSLAQ